MQKPAAENYIFAAENRMSPAHDLPAASRIRQVTSNIQHLTFDIT